MYTDVYYNIVGNDVKVMSRNFNGRGVKGQGHRYIRNMKMYNMLYMYVLTIISKGIDIFYTHIHWNIVCIDARYTLANFRGHGVKGQGHRYINIPKWLIILETIDILYTHIHYNIVRIDATMTLTNFRGQRSRSRIH